MTGDRGMIGRLVAMTDDELAGSLTDLSQSIAYPRVGDDFADRVIARITAGGAGSGAPARGAERIRSAFAPLATLLGGPPLRRALVLALIALLVLALAAAAIGLGVPGIRIIFAPASSATASPVSLAPSHSAGLSSSPTSTTRPSPTPPSPFIGGRSVSLAQAQAGAGFEVFVPSDPVVGQPQRIFLDGEPPFSRVTLSYGEGGLLTEFLGAVDPDAFQKILRPGTTIEALTIGGKPAYWISGEPHELHYQLPNGFDRWDSVQVVGNVLLWQRGDVTLRLESPLAREDALRIASSAQ